MFIKTRIIIKLIKHYYCTISNILPKILNTSLEELYISESICKNAIASSCNIVALNIGRESLNHPLYKITLCNTGGIKLLFLAAKVPFLITISSLVQSSGSPSNESNPYIFFKEFKAAIKFIVLPVHTPASIYKPFIVIASMPAFNTWASEESFFAFKR